MLETLNQLTQDEQGLYRSSNADPISYPADGNQDCFLLEDNSFWFQHRNKCITSIIKRYPPSGSIIDVGGGNGYVSRGILDAGFDVVLLEPGVEGAVNARVKRKIPTVICSTFKGAGFVSSSINAIGVFDVIEHIENDRELIDDFFQVLESDGYLYITVPAHNWLWSQSDVHAQHHRRYNRTMIDELLAERFEVVYFSYFFSILSMPIYIFRALPFRLSFIKDNVLSKNTEHGMSKGLGTKLMNFFLGRENKKIQQGKRFNFGASCLIVAKKIN